MLLDCLFMWLINNCSHDIWKYTKLIEIAHFYTYIKSFFYLNFIHLKNQCDAFEAVTEKLGKIIVEVLVDEGEVLLEVGCKLVQVEEDFLEVLLDQCQDFDEFYVTKSRDDIISYWVVLVAY